MGVGDGTGMGDGGMGDGVVDRVVEGSELFMGDGEGTSRGDEGMGDGGTGDGIIEGTGVGGSVGVGGARPSSTAAAARVLTSFVTVLTSGAFDVSTVPTAETAEVSSPVWDILLSWPAAASGDTEEAPTFWNSKLSLAFDAVDSLRPPPCVACVLIDIFSRRVRGSCSMFLTWARAMLTPVAELAPAITLRNISAVSSTPSGTATVWTLPPAKP